MIPAFNVRTLVMKFILFIILLLPACSVAENFVVIHAASYHPDVRSYNEINPGIGFRSYNDKTFFAIGAYKNSISKESAYIGAGIKVASYKNVDVSLTAGIITGYILPIAPFVIPEFSVNFKNVKLLINYIPKVTINDRTVDQAVGLSVAIKF